MSLFETCAQRSLPDCRYCLMRGPETRLRLVAMSSLTWTLAHEISQPLTAVRNYIQVSVRQLRRRGHGVEDLAAMMEDAGKEAARAADIVSRMRSFIVHGKVAARRENLGQMIVNASRPLGSRGCADVEIVTDVDPGARYVIADRVQIEQAFSIILLNACEALVDCSIRRITISARRKGGEVIILISDTGPGLPDYVVPRLFEPLFTTKADGMGLGLPICRVILEAHGGRIWAEKSAGGGAVFGLSLPTSG